MLHSGMVGRTTYEPLQCFQLVTGKLVHAGYSDRHSWKGEHGCQPLELHQSGVSFAVWHFI